jgi:HEXXH motif-containing protein
MNDDEFLEFSEKTFAEGQSELADAMRTLVAREDGDVYDALAEGGDRAFLEPLLFTYFFAKPERLGLPQIAFGNVPPDARPCELPVQTDASGRAYLPGVGHLVTSCPERWLTLGWSPSEGLTTLRDEDGTRVAFFVRERTVVPGTDVEILWAGNPLLDATFTDIDGRPVGQPVPSVGEEHAESITRALRLLETHEPEYSVLVQRATRQVFAFRWPRVNCFATLNAHGVVYFNASPRDDEVYFVDELAHQCGHVVFNAMTVRRRQLFRADPDARIADLCPEVARHEERSLYTVLHGLYTERAMVRCLRKLDERRVFEGRQAHELRGRLAFILTKMRIDVENVAHPGLFTPLGEDLVDTFRATYLAAERERPELLRHDMGEQPYNFDYETYARRNPFEGRSAAAE